MATQQRDNDDIRRVLKRLIAIEHGVMQAPAANDDPADTVARIHAQVAPPAAPSLNDFLRDHVHNPALPQLLAELSPPR